MTCLYVYQVLSYFSDFVEAVWCVFHKIHWISLLHLKTSQPTCFSALKTHPLLRIPMIVYSHHVAKSCWVLCPRLEPNCGWRFRTRTVATSTVCGDISIPIGSMYGIFTYIWLISMVNVGKYTIPWEHKTIKNEGFMLHPRFLRLSLQNQVSWCDYVVICLWYPWLCFKILMVWYQIVSKTSPPVSPRMCVSFCGPLSGSKVSWRHLDTAILPWPQRVLERPGLI